MISYWEKNVLTTYDTIIVGSGLSGLFTAWFLKKKFPNQKIIVLEKELFPTAGTKNAGFTCMGSITELEDDLSNSDLDEVVQLFEKRYHGLQIMRDELGDANIGYAENGSYELLAADSEHVLERIDFWNEKLFSVVNRNAFTIENSAVKNFSGFTRAVKNELEGEINTGLMWHSLLTKVMKAGVEVLRNTTVESYEKTADGYEVRALPKISFCTNRLIFCANAFTKQLLPDIKITPARAQVLVTKPIDNLLFKGVYHFDRGYYYFREIDGRVLFGGGRQLDKRGETTSQVGENEIILDDLQEKLQRLILPNTSFELDYTWSGIMGFSGTKNPFCKKVDDQLFVLAGFGGMGVALAPYMAKELVNRAF